MNFVREYCHDDYLPSAVLRCGEIITQQWLDRVVREEDKVTPAGSMLPPTLNARPRYVTGL